MERGLEDTRRKLAWGCRRGMLELDVILAPLAHRLKSMPESELCVTEKFLKLGDDELWDLLVSGNKAVSTEFEAVMAALK